MTTPPPEPQPAPGDAGLAGRVDQIERKQDGLDTKLDRIIGMFSDTDVTRADDPAAAQADMTEQMKEAVRAVNAEAAAAKTEPGKPAPETTPREVMVKGKERLQAAIFGKDPK